MGRPGAEMKGAEDEDVEGGAPHVCATAVATMDILNRDEGQGAATLGVAIINPKRHYTSGGNGDVYDAWVARMKEERHAFLNKYEVDPAIIAATINP